MHQGAGVQGLDAGSKGDNPVLSRAVGTGCQQHQGRPQMLTLSAEGLVEDPCQLGIVCLVDDLQQALFH